MPLPSLADQAERLVRLGVHDLAGIPAERLHEVAGDGGRDRSGGGLLVTAAPASALAPLLTRGAKRGFVVEDMTDLDSFVPTEAVTLPPATPYVVTGLDRGDSHLDRTPAECEPEILAAGRSPLTVVEGLHWVLQDPEVLARNACFMTIGSRLRKPNGTYDARTPALWISNGTGRDGRERRDAPKVGWCWWGNRHTWLGIASCSARV